MRIRFDYINIEGFRSILGPVQFSFETDGLHLVKGDNGAGKTTLFEALVWCLYGENLKGTTLAKVKPWEEIQPARFNGTRVEVGLSVGNRIVIVTRHLSHTEGKDSLVLKDGNDIIPYEDKDDLQRQINELLGMDYRVFVNSFLFGQRMAKLVSTSNADKRKLFEDLFDMNWIAGLKEKVDKDLTEAKDKVRNLEDRLSVREDYLAGAKQDLKEAVVRYEEMVTENEQEQERHEMEIRASKDAITKYTKELQEAQKWMNEVDLGQSLEDEISKKHNDMDSLDVDISNLEKDIKADKEAIENLESVIEALTGSHIDEIMGQIKALEEDREKLVAEYGFDTKGNEADLKLSYEALENDIDSCNKEIGFLEKDLVVMQHDIDKVLNNPICPKCGQTLPDIEKIKEDLEAEKKEVEQKLEDTKEELKEYKERLDTHTWPKFVELTKIEDEIAKLKKQIPEGADEKVKAAKDKIKGKQKAIKANTEQVGDMDAQAAVLEGQIRDLQLELTKKYDPIRKEYEKKKSDIEELQRDIHEEENGIKELQRLITSLPERLLPQKGHITSLEEKVESAEEDVKGMSAAYEKAKETVVGIEWWSKKALAANGIKAYVFKAMLEQLNQYTDKYGSKLGVSIKFSLDLAKVSTPFSTICSVGDRINKEYKEFSGGQQQRLDIVLMFAMHDLLSSIGNPLSIMILDEALDGLDVQGESDAFDLIREKSAEQAVYVITHSQVLDTLHTKAINVVSNNGVTEIR